MNRVLKKAVSFFSAVVVSVSALAAGTVSAQAASSVKLKQAISNNYEAVVSLENSALFISDVDSNGGAFTIPKSAKMVMMNNEGKTVKLKNTTGFDKIYTIGTMYQPYVVGQNFEWSVMGNLIILNSGNKYTALLENGKFLEKGKLFDRISYNTYITAASGKTNYVYDTNGKLIGKFKVNPSVTCVGYDKSSKTFVAYQAEDYSYHYYLIKGNKIIKTFKNCYPSSMGMVTVNKKNYLHIRNDDGEFYYSMKGKKANVTYTYDYSSSAPDCAVTLTDDYDNHKLVLKNAKTGKVLKSYAYNEKMWYHYFNSIHTLKNGKSFFISWNKKCTKFGCLLF